MPTGCVSGASRGALAARLEDEVAAGPRRRGVVVDDARAVAVALVIILLLDEPDLLGLVVGQAARGHLGEDVVARFGGGGGRDDPRAVALGQLRVDVARRPRDAAVGAERDDGERRHAQGEEGRAELVALEEDAGRERRAALQTEQPVAAPRNVRQEPARLAEDQVVEPDFQELVVEPRPFDEREPFEPRVEPLADGGLLRERAVQEAEAHFGPVEEVRVAFDHP